MGPDLESVFEVLSEMTVHMRQSVAFAIQQLTSSSSLHSFSGYVDKHWGISSKCWHYLQFCDFIYVLSFIFNEFIFHFSLIEEKMGHRGRWNPGFCGRLIFTQIF